MVSNPCNYPLKIWESIEIPISKMGVQLGVWGFNPSHSFALSKAWDVIPGLPSRPATLQAFALVASLRLRLWHKSHDLVSLCRNPTLAKCGGEAQHFQSWGIWSPPGLPNV
jgi:hypothetical protein